jgi:hypothetical protein
MKKKESDIGCFCFYYSSPSISHSRIKTFQLNRFDFITVVVTRFLLCL